MDITINKNFPLSIKEQLKRQLETMIEEGRLMADEMLLSAKDMGLFLNINRNTVALAYKELEHKGFLKIIKGSGTFVRELTPEMDKTPLKKIFNLAHKHARQSGFSLEDINNFFITGLLEKSGKARTGFKIILIGSHYEVLETLDREIKSKCDIDTHFMLIQDIKKIPGKFIKRAKEYDMIICAMNHMEELKAAAPDLAHKTTGFLMKTDFQIINQIMRLPAGTFVGYCCISEKSAEAFSDATMAGSGSSIDRICAGIDDKKSIQAMVTSCKIIFASHYVYDRLIKNLPARNNIHCITMEIDPGNLEFIVSQLEKGVIKTSS